jgi:hypothetical protein
MIRSRRKHAALAAGASVLVAMASLAIVPLSASATGTAGTTTALTATPSATTTGGGVTVAAKVAPVTTNASVPTGTVAFTITGHDGSLLSCKNPAPVTINHQGKATCVIPAAKLLAAASPYTVQGQYSGDGNFAGSTGSTSVTVSAARTLTKLRVHPPVSNGSANVFTAQVKSGKANSLLSGIVRFSVVSSGPTSSKKLVCAGGDKQPLAVSGNVATATCSLSSGWFTVPKKTKTDKHPVGTYGVTATYIGNGNFLSSQKTKSGSIG